MARATRATRPLVGQRCDDDVPMRILALAAAADSIDAGYYVVNDLSIDAIHRFESDLLTRLQGLLGHLAGELSQGRSATGTNPTHVHPDLAFAGAATGSLQHCTDQLIYGLRGSTSSPYKESYTFSVSFDSKDSVLHVMPREGERNAERVPDPLDEGLC